MNFDRFVLLSLAGTVWFGAFFRAAHDFWAACVLFLTVTLLAIAQIIFKTRARIPMQFPLAGTLVLMLVVIWLSTFASWDVTNTLWDAWGWTFAVIAFYLGLNSLRTPEDGEWFSLRLGAVVFPLAAIALVQQMTDYPRGISMFTFPFSAQLPYGPWVLSLGNWEIRATLLNSVVFSGFIACCAFVYWTTPRQTLWTRLGVAAGLLGVILGRSWLTWIALGAGVLFMFASRVSNPQNAKWVRRGFIFLLGAVLLALAYKWNLSFTYAEPTAYQATSRLSFWGSAVRMFLAYPWTGVGLSAYGAAAPFFKSGPGEQSLFVHSFPFQMFAELGLGGILAFSVLGFQLWKIKIWGHRPAFGVLVIILVMALASVFLDFFLMRYVMGLFLAIAVWSVSLRATPKIILRPIWSAVGVALLCTCASSWMKLFQAERLYAAGDYVNAVALNPYHASAYLKLSEAEPDASQALAYRNMALRYKKSWAKTLDLRHQSYNPFTLVPQPKRNP